MIPKKDLGKKKKVSHLAFVRQKRKKESVIPNFCIVVFSGYTFQNTK